MDGKQNAFSRILINKCIKHWNSVTLGAEGCDSVLELLLLLYEALTLIPAPSFWKKNYCQVVYPHGFRPFKTHIPVPLCRTFTLLKIVYEWLDLMTNSEIRLDLPAGLSVSDLIRPSCLWLPLPSKSFPSGPGNFFCGWTAFIVWELFSTCSSDPSPWNVYVVVLL